ncbi:DUF2256 domain-containing protein [Sphingomonas sp. MA1305]|uniref:DUF2256 domain-containing protein n=1 Tax=unclassified Sphingomonas TaxID=196159 RepID=UPI0018E011E8|nr:DUF2256 domain-containing protein [Sphingomonas sp. MA1305]MBI0475029.1 DUF2256 domain-containing protein [Sphingomonas sp. MA1305]
MPNGVAKRDLPTKVCPACGRPFSWRKKWARDWDSVIYCSDKCRKSRGKTASLDRIDA